LKIYRLVRSKWPTATATLALVASSFAAVAPPRSSAHWPRGSRISVWIDPARAPAEGDRLVERAMQTWTQAAMGRFSLHRWKTREGAAIRVHFFRDDYRYGVTSPRVDERTGAIVDAEVAVNASSTSGEIDPTWRIILYLTALHELGHALGLPHTTNFDDIMYQFSAPGDGPRYFGNYRNRLGAGGEVGVAATGLSAGDLQALRDLYDR
jgi:hypothetical protein